MNNPFTNLASILIGFALLAVVVFGGYYLLVQVYDLFHGLDYALNASLLIALISALIIGGGLRHIGRMQGVHRLRLEKKADVYSRLVIAVFRLLEADSDVGGKTAAELETAVLELMLWGSSSVLKQLLNVHSLDPQDPEFETALENLLWAMRRDLGHSNLSLSQGDLLELLFRDEDTRTDKT